MVIRPAILAGALMVVGGAVPSGGFASVPLQASTCAAAGMLLLLNTNESPGAATGSLETWIALIRHEPDGVANFQSAGKRMGGDLPEIRRVLKACVDADLSQRIPDLPQSHAEGSADCDAQMAKAETLKKAGFEATTPEASCHAFRRVADLYAGIADDLEAGRIACADPKAAWIRASVQAQVVQGEASGVGCGPRRAN